MTRFLVSSAQNHFGECGHFPFLRIRIICTHVHSGFFVPCPCIFRKKFVRFARCHVIFPCFCHCCRIHWRGSCCFLNRRDCVCFDVGCDGLCFFFFAGHHQKRGNCKR